MTMKKRQSGNNKWFIYLLFGTTVMAVLLVTAFALMPGTTIKNTLEKFSETLFETGVPEEYIPLYQKAADAYGIPWTLLAAHHRVETKFSTMDPLLSYAGAEGHMQFMPCTFVGWEHPTCTDLGKGDIPENEKTDIETIQKYGGYGVDGDGDGIADPYNLEDALHSAANFLSHSGAAAGEVEHAIFKYNYSEEYVEDVLFYYKKYEEQYR